MKDFIEITLAAVGVGVVLHYYAFAIAWGVAKGWAKVKHVVEHTGTQTQVHRTQASEPLKAE